MKKLLDILKLAGIWLTLFGLWACVGWDSRDLNPAIFPAFRAIEKQCLAERWPHETVRCERVLDRIHSWCFWIGSENLGTYWLSRQLEVRSHWIDRFRLYSDVRGLQVWINAGRFRI